MSDVTDRGSAPHPTRRRRRAVHAMTLTTALAAMLLVPAAAAPSAHAAEQPVVRRSATLTSFDGDAPEGMPRVTRAAVAQDVAARTVTATVTWAAAPRSDDPSAAYVYLGTLANGTCNARLGLAVHGGLAKGAARLLPADTPVTSRTSASGTSATVTASGSSALGTTAYTCAYAVTATATSTFQTTGWTSLAVERRKAPRLDAVVREPRIGATTKGWTSVKVRLDNDGDATASGVVVRVRGTGIKASRATTKVKAIAPGKSRTVTLKLRLTTARTRTATVTVTTTGGHKDTARITVLPRRSTTTPKSVSGKLFYGWDSSLDDAWQPRVVWFVSSSWAYVGVPTKGRPTCRSGVKGCVKYSYDRRTGKVKVGRSSGKVTSKSLYLVPKGTKSRTWYSTPVSIPKAGSRYDVRLVHEDASGCGYGYGKTCYTSTTRLRLSKDGRFSQARSSLTSGGGWYIGGGADEKGRYTVLSKGRIRLAYANGKVAVKTFGIMQDVREVPDAKHEGVLLGAAHYYP